MVATVFDFIYALDFKRHWKIESPIFRLAAVGATEGLVSGLCLYLENRPNYKDITVL